MVYWIWNNLGTCNMFESYTEAGVIIVDVRDLQDGPDNTVEVVKQKIILIANLLGCGQKVIVRCMAGMSRSNTIACAVLLCMCPNHDWEYYWTKVQKKCPRAAGNLDFIDTVKQALLEIGVKRKLLYYD